MIDKWRAILDMCEERGTDPRVIFRPTEHRDDRSVVERAYILRYLRQDHKLSPRQMSLILPMSERTIWRLIGRN